MLGMSVACQQESSSSLHKTNLTECFAMKTEKPRKTVQPQLLKTVSQALARKSNKNHEEEDEETTTFEELSDHA
jgi:hypothetical protein